MKKLIVKEKQIKNVNEFIEYMHKFDYVADIIKFQSSLLGSSYFMDMREILELYLLYEKYIDDKSFYVEKIKNVLGNRIEEKNSFTFFKNINQQRKIKSYISKIQTANYYNNEDILKSETCAYDNFLVDIYNESVEEKCTNFISETRRPAVTTIVISKEKLGNEKTIMNSRNTSGQLRIDDYNMIKQQIIDLYFNMNWDCPVHRLENAKLINKDLNIIEEYDCVEIADYDRIILESKMEFGLVINNYKIIPVYIDENQTAIRCTNITEDYKEIVYNFIRRRYDYDMWRF